MEKLKKEKVNHFLLHKNDLMKNNGKIKLSTSILGLFAT